MLMTIKVNDIEVKSVASISPDLVVDDLYNVQTLDGKIHRKIKGKRTNYDLVFFNNLSSDNLFYTLIDLFSSGEIVTLTVPKNRYETETADFHPDITSYNAKGYLNDGTFYHNGLAVSFERVGYDD